MTARRGVEIERGVTEEHAHQASFLWILRDRAAKSPRYDLVELRDLDDRLDAHLDGLRIAGDAGFAVSLAAATDTTPLRPGGAPRTVEPGAVFVAAVLAVERWDLRALARILDVAGGAPDRAKEIAAALGWMPFERTNDLLPGLLAARNPPALQWLGVTACALHRRDPGPALGFAVLSGDARLRARALRAAGEIGRVDLLGDLRAALRAEDESIRFAAAWSAAILGEPAGAPELLRFARGGGPYAERACATAVRRLDPAAALAEVRALAGEGHVRAALAGAAALGDPAVFPWLFEPMESEETTRLAGFVLAQMTGIDLATEKLVGAPPEDLEDGPSDDPGDEDVAMDPDDGLPWPDIMAARAWWARRGGDFRRGQRYAGGHPIDSASLEALLRNGRQPLRGAAAEELAMRDRGRAVFEVRAPGERQMRVLGIG